MKHGMVISAIHLLISSGTVWAEEGQISRQKLSRLGLGGLQTEFVPGPPPRIHTHGAPAYGLPAYAPPVFGQRQLHTYSRSYQRDNLSRVALRIALRATRF